MPVSGLRSFATGLRSSVSGQPSSPALRRSDSRPSAHPPMSLFPCLPVHLSTCFPVYLFPCLPVYCSTNRLTQRHRRGGDEAGTRRCPGEKSQRYVPQDSLWL